MQSSLKTNVEKSCASLSSTAKAPGAVAKGGFSGYRCAWRFSLATSLTLLALTLSSSTTSAGTLTLNWDIVTGTNITYRVYQATGTGPFVAVQVNLTVPTALVGYDATVLNQWYVTAYSPAYGMPESVPSNIVVRQPPPTTLPGLTFEAEAGTLNAPYYVTNGAVVQDVQTTVASDGGRASYAFTITNAGTYTVSALVNAPDGGADSVFVGMDTEPGDANVWSIPNTVGFEKRSVRFSGETNDHAFALTASQHTLIFRGREAGCQLDSLSIIPTAIQVPPNPIPGPPPSPTNLRSVQIVGKRVDLSWNSVLDAATEVERSVNAAAFSWLQTVSAGTLHTSVTISKNQNYAFRVRAVNSAGTSGYSNTTIVSSR